MGLLDIFKRKDKKKSPNISFEIKMTDANGNEIDADSEEYLREREERERRRAEDEARRAELQEANRQFLLDSGVDVNLFTPMKVIGDALSTIEQLCPTMGMFDHGLKDEEPLITYSSPTKTGKVPKNVVTAHLAHEVVEERYIGVGDLTVPEYGDSLQVSLSYLANGDLNKVDIVGWHEHHGISVSIRAAKGIPSITYAGLLDQAADRGWRSLCPFVDATSEDFAIAIAKEIVRIYK